MDPHFAAAVALLVGFAVPAAGQSGDGAADRAADPTANRTSYLILREKADPHFITSIERLDPCELTGPALETGQVRIPQQLFPRESLINHESGTVTMQLVFDPGWCVRKVAILQSSKYWRLDEISLHWAINTKWKPKITKFTPAGEPTVTLPLAWQAPGNR